MQISDIDPRWDNPKVVDGKIVYHSVFNDPNFISMYGSHSKSDEMIFERVNKKCPTCGNVEVEKEVNACEIHKMFLEPMNPTEYQDPYTICPRCYYGEEIVIV